MVLLAMRKLVELPALLVYECTVCGQTFSDLDDSLNHSC